MGDWKEKVNIALEYREKSLKAVEPAIESLPDPLPLNSQDLPKQYLTEREYELTQNYDAIELLDLLRSRKLSSEELTRAFLRRAALAQYATNCLTELLWDDAIQRAKYLDSLPEPLGPFHGLPISVKEYHSLRGKPTHGSCVCWVGSDANPNQMNDILWNAGCVFIARTTGPQALMHLECISNIYGRTVNPYNRNLTSGGSSGGEGALIGFRGSILGLGGDIGGSIRAPAADNGIYGFKPSTYRLPSTGSKTPLVGKDSINSTMGPMTTSRRTLELFMHTLLAAAPWRFDPMLTVKFWTPVKFDRPLKIAFLWDDGIVRPHPPITRALNIVADACRAAGHTVLDWQPLEHDRAWSIISRLYFVDGGKAVLAKFAESGEPLLPLTEWIMTQPGIKDHTMQEYWALCAERNSYRAAYAAHWSATADSEGKGEVDVIVAPIGPSVAPLHETSKYWSYTSQWNLVDYPACTFPVTTIDEEKDVRGDGYEGISELDRWNWSLYEGPETYQHAPVCLQVVARKGMDETCLAALEVIEKAMGRE